MFIFLSHVGINLAYRLKWALSGLFTIRAMYFVQFLELDTDNFHGLTWS